MWRRASWIDGVNDSVPFSRHQGLLYTLLRWGRADSWSARAYTHTHRQSYETTIEVYTLCDCIACTGECPILVILHSWWTWNFPLFATAAAAVRCCCCCNQLPAVVLFQFYNIRNFGLIITCCHCECRDHWRTDVCVRNRVQWSDEFNDSSLSHIFTSRIASQICTENWRRATTTTTAVSSTLQWRCWQASTHPQIISYLIIVISLRRPSRVQNGNGRRKRRVKRNRINTLLGIVCAVLHTHAANT